MMRVIRQLVLSVLLMLNFSWVHANIYDPGHRMVVLMVGVKADELAEYERGLLKQKQVIEISRTDNWQQSILRNNAQEVILKQNTGFVGLYTPNGSLVRGVNLIGSEFPANKTPAETEQLTHLMGNQEYGYNSAGRIDPYQPINVYEPKDNKQIAAGYGYNTQIDQPRVFKKSAWIDFLNFAPIDVVTPFNYPGHFDQTGIAPAYTLGVLPHIGGLLAARQRAKAERQNYEYYKQQSVQGYVERPMQSYNPAEPENPITTDPNFMRFHGAGMPEAFEKSYPGYGMQPMNYYNSP